MVAVNSPAPGALARGQMSGPSWPSADRCLAYPGRCTLAVTESASVGGGVEWPPRGSVAVLLEGAVACYTRG